MSRDQIFNVIYAGIALFCTYLLGARLLAGEWMSSLIPLAIVAICGYRLYSLNEA